MAKQNKGYQTGAVRIIAGRWRGRKLTVPNVSGLRPTPDRVRETVFNWLQPLIGDTHCLDLFSGSGVLGFEAASRGAKQVDMVELDTKVAMQLQDNCQLLNAENCHIIQNTAQRFLMNNSMKYDVVFIDPPYQADLWAEIAQLLVDSGCLVGNAHIYLEYPSKIDLPVLPKHWNLKKDKKAGDVRYCLFINEVGEAE
ncbi:MAG: 16S rRNA (guanine(966)-N(2))-methyltransferase RsmD [Gammaproteobacteria bacterium]|nr:MAG: 16S rRNA (guanine(966)-N(2))-methyltransferase RsmD [Gammaproteobacteria bacterium]